MVDWNPCGRAANSETKAATDPARCMGKPVPGSTVCLAHLSLRRRHQYLASLAPGDDIDHSSTPFTAELLYDLLRALWDPITGQSRFGDASFKGSTFAEDAFFGDYRVAFTGDTSFAYATFKGASNFNYVTFDEKAYFERATFNGSAYFDNATFTGDVDFRKATFNNFASFNSATFGGQGAFGEVRFSNVSFRQARFIRPGGFAGSTFCRSALFDGAIFFRDAGFGGARFITASSFGPLVCAGKLLLDGVVFEAPVTMEIAARKVSCVRTRWGSTAELRLRYATLNLNDAVLSSPVAVTMHDATFIGRFDKVIGVNTIQANVPEAVDESLLAIANTPADPSVKVASVRGVDAAHLVLRGVDLSECVFSGAFHLDRLGLEGDCIFARAPIGTDRRTLAEEHHWRAQKARSHSRGWRPGPGNHAPEAGEVAATYRHLRKALEDSKNEPGAADFYYGEMEMRRHDKKGSTAAERWLLKAYWLFAGYGLRALRALVWLVVIMAMTVTLLMMFGLPPMPGPTQQSTLTVTPLGLSTAPVDPSGAAPSDWFTGSRLDRAIRTALNSAIFRSAGEGLTTNGTYIEMAARLIEPILLVLVLLAVRSRVKR